jgi:outer membrane receptor protein involved in Fe transport
MSTRASNSRRGSGVKPLACGGSTGSIRAIGCGLTIIGAFLGAASAQEAVELPTIDVVAQRPGEGPQQAASEKNVSGDTVNQQIFTRPAEALEVTPGLVITQHSGEGKANQYFLRGFNLDHGTDLAITMDGMPMNMRTHAHGQGYADMNFLIPELVGNVNVRKGPYFADQGDFATAGALSIDLINFVDKPYAQVTVGSFGYRRLLGVGSAKIGEGNLLIAGEVGTYNGPWTNPDDMKKLNGVVRYSQGDALNGFSVTGMAYQNKWNSTDQIPARAVSSGLIGLYGALDPTDGGNDFRYSISGRWAQTDAKGGSRVDVYAVRSGLNLFNDFGFFTNDPVNGDQFHQRDLRTIAGLNASHTINSSFGSLPVETTFGVQGRADDIKVALTNTFNRQYLSDIRTDFVKENSIGVYAQSTIHWTDWFKTTIGWRGDYYTASDNSVFNAANSGNVNAFMGSPKLSMVFGPFAKTEFFINAGYGFHSNDVRGATITQEPNDPTTPVDKSPFLVRTKGAEVGVRTKIIDGLESSLALFILTADSENVFNGDGGDTSPSGPTRRMGFEWTNDYRPVSWLSLEADLSMSSARFTKFDADQAATYASLAGYPQSQIGNAPGYYVPGAAGAVATLGLTLGEKTGWFGGVKYRYFGPRPLTEDGAFWSPALGQLSARVGYRFENGWRVELEGTNLTNSRSDQISYAYGTILKTDSLYAACFPVQTVPAAVCQNGVMDRVFHPVEPLAVRLTVAGTF